MAVAAAAAAAQGQMMAAATTAVAGVLLTAALALRVVAATAAAVVVVTVDEAVLGLIMSCTGEISAWLIRTPGGACSCCTTTYPEAANGKPQNRAL